MRRDSDRKVASRIPVLSINAYHLTGTLCGVKD